MHLPEPFLLVQEHEMLDDEADDDAEDEDAVDGVADAQQAPGATGHGVDGPAEGVDDGHADEELRDQDDDREGPDRDDRRRRSGRCCWS